MSSKTIVEKKNYFNRPFLSALLRNSCLKEKKKKKSLINDNNDNKISRKKHLHGQIFIYLFFSIINFFAQLMWRIWSDLYFCDRLENEITINI